MYNVKFLFGMVARSGNKRPLADTCLNCSRNQFANCEASKVAGPVVKMTRMLSLVVHLASAAGDPRALAMASLCIFGHTLGLSTE